MAEKLHTPSEIHDGSDPGEPDFYHDPVNDPYSRGDGGRISMHEFPHVINGSDGPHAAWVVQPGNLPDVDGKFKSWPKIPITETQSSEHTPGSRPISSAQARRNGEGFEREWSRTKRSGNWGG